MTQLQNVQLSTSFIHDGLTSATNEEHRSSLLPRTNSKFKTSSNKQDNDLGLLTLFEPDVIPLDESDGDYEGTLTASTESLELKIHTQNAVVLTAEQFNWHARKMGKARQELTDIIITSPQALLIMAAEFLDSLSKGVDISELINRSGCEQSQPVQNSELVQDTAKGLEIKLTNCFQKVINAEESINVELTLQECRLALRDIQFLPNFLQQVVYSIKSQGQNKEAGFQDEALVKTLLAKLKGMVDSRQAMINGNLRLVTYIARQYNNQTLSFSDLIQEGTVGLIKAVDRFDFSRSVRFSTYAIYWIKQTISRVMVRQEKTVRLPYNIAAKASAVYEAMNSLHLQNNRWPSVIELAEKCKLPEDEIKAIIDNYQPTVSLFSNINNNEDMPEVIDTLEQHHYPQPINTLAASALKACLRKAIGTLPAREADIITCRFGLDNDHEMTLQDIAEHLSLTRERVRQIQNSALLKLKNNFSHELIDFLEPG
ncbi:RNA polymerase sigma factor RpoD/SigA [Methylicorpusculum sp.]|uniref:sigma-70 family RNA polymerase sigma factor n=2 Tax=Methylicorpusculum sp. TaxID=2713644 RepID=UPI00273199DB|nr:RNA polymerase sigma factor RpoD/SigA [Methylicorpusculum sp.]MDP2177373.1 RNA polymerase sigma factor RpoD/SigA [Methylicorpusculum sp.]MDP3530980.1 RNA polymerase sigma factor RpoD/SigA [Methylicorpusculum sp.]